MSQINREYGISMFTCALIKEFGAVIVVLFGKGEDRVYLTNPYKETDGGNV